jgi:capsular exopolysaccharide synthesis family protein
MSNLFDSLTKADLICAEDFVLQEGEDNEFANLLMAEPAAPGVQAEPVSPPAQAKPASLRVSALSPVFPFDEEHHGAGEQYRVIRTKVLHHPRKPKLIVVSSGGSGDGKTITSINLAASLALKNDLRVALVDADMRRPQVASLLGLDSSPGLAEILNATASFKSAAVATEQLPNLWILPAGEQRHMQSELLDSAHWIALVAMLRKTFDYVIFDAPPIATVADHELIQLACDGVVVVARPDHSERKTCLKAIEMVPKEKLLGVVLNCVENWFLWRTHGYDYYGQKQNGTK